MEQRDQMLDLIIKAQRSSMRSGAEKKSWVMAQLDGTPDLAAWVDFVVMVLKDPQVHSLFVAAQRGWADRLREHCRGKSPNWWPALNLCEISFPTELSYWLSKTNRVLLNTRRSFEGNCLSSWQAGRIPRIKLHTLSWTAQRSTDTTLVICRCVGYA